MRTLQTLAVAGATTTGSTGISTVTPEIWGAAVEQAAQELRVARNYIRVYTDLMKSGDVLHIPTGGTLTASGTSEATAIAASEITSYNTVDFTPVEYGVVAAISRQTVDELHFDVMKDVTTQIARALAQHEDDAILAELGQTTPESNQNAVYSGSSNTQLSDLGDGDIISIDDFADAVTEVEVDNYEGDVLFIHPRQRNVFIKDGTFVNATEYGDDTVVKKGTLGDYLGVKIVSTTNVEANTAGTAGHDSVLLDSAHAAGIAIKRNAGIETKYEPTERLHYIVGTLSYDTELISTKASCVIYSTDA